MESKKELYRSRLFLDYIYKFNQRIKAFQEAEEYFRQSSMIEAMNIPIDQHADYFDHKIEEFSDKVEQIDKEFLRDLQLDPRLGLPQTRMNLSVFKQEIRKEFNSKKMALFDDIYLVIERMITRHQELHKSYQQEIQHIEMDFIDGKIDELEYISRVLGDSSLDEQSEITERGVSSISFRSED